MELGYKHFSHTHKLEMHKMLEGAEVSCSGCNSSANKTIYACWQCNFFLHEQCFLATRSKNHPSHPLHSLTLVPYHTYLSNSFYCNNCKIIGTGFSYTCSDCNFDLHVHCAYTLSDSTYAHQPNPVISTHPDYSSYPNPEIVPQHFHGQSSSINPYPTNMAHDSYMAQHVPPFTAPNPTTSAQNSFIPQYPTSITHHSNMTYNVSHFDVLPISHNLTTTPQNAYSSQNYMNIPASAQNLPIPQNTTYNLAPSASYEQLSHFGESGHKIANNKGIIHFSHPHGLVWGNMKHVKKKITCSGCQESLVGKGYVCVEENCGFQLDEPCINLKKEIRHKSHPAHPLSLLSSSPYKYENGVFACGACFKNGSGFTYHCSICEYDLDIKCANLKETVKRDDHQHVLKLCYKGPLNGEDYVFNCDVCKRVVPREHWAYYRQECDYGTHLDCVHSEECDNSGGDPDSEQSLYEAILTAKMDALGRKYALELWD